MTAVTWLFPISCALRTARSGGFSDTRNGRRRLADEGEDHTGTARSTTAGKPTIVEPQTFGTSVHLLAPASAGVQTTCAYPPVHRRHPSYRSQVGEVRVAATTESSPMVGSSSTCDVAEMANSERSLHQCRSDGSGLAEGAPECSAATAAGSVTEHRLGAEICSLEFVDLALGLWRRRSSPPPKIGMTPSSSP